MQTYKPLPLRLAQGPLANDAELLAQRYFLEKLGIRSRGVIHLGAHVGQELAMYAVLGLHKMVMVEPLEEEFAKLVRAAAEFNDYFRTMTSFLGAEEGPYAHPVRCAVSDREGTATLYRTRLTTMTSLHEPNVAAFSKHFGELSPLAPWYVRPFLRLGARAAIAHRKVEVPCKTLDQVMASLPRGWRPADFGLLRLNIQGAELEALRGAEEQLRHVELVFLETNVDPRYEGAPSKEECDAFLGERGFACVFAYHLSSVGNVLYTRRSRP